MRPVTPYPARILQFGGGNFLRAFVDWMVQGMNERVGFCGSVRLTKATRGTFPAAFARQGFSYNVVVRGKDGTGSVSRRDRVTCISGASNSYTDFDGFLGDAADPNLEVIVSNTTEAGLVYVESDQSADRPASSFPGKLTQFLRARFVAFGGSRESGVLVLPCELVEKNGSTLRLFVRQHARRWYDDDAFDVWLADDCTWLDTLVDRIVPGHDPEERATCCAQTGFDDELLVVAEPYHLLVIGGPEREDVLPLRKAGFNVVWTNDVAPYRTRKVRILNGGHTLLAMVGLGLGVASVRDALEHPLLGRALEAFYSREVLPLIPLPEKEVEAYRAAVIDRFANPFVVHKLADIALNSVSKYAARILPTARQHTEKLHEAPAFASFALAALLDRYLYTSGVVDVPAVLAQFEEIAARHGSSPRDAARAALSSEALWGRDVVIPSEVQVRATEMLVRIREHGMREALEALLSGES
jgi:tagaturonate reductase